MNILNIYQTTNPERNTAEAISNCLNQNCGSSILFLVSGGSSLKVLNYIDLDTLGSHITVSLVDDRFSRNSEVNNFLQLTRTEFYKKAKARGVEFISSLPKEGESLEGVSDRWESELCQWYAERKLDRFVVALLGIGLNGHTAGIMPFPEDPSTFDSLFMKKERWIIAYNAGNKDIYSDRVTASVSFLQSVVNHSFVYVSGENKRNVLKEVMKLGNLYEYPARIIHVMKLAEVHTDIFDV